MLRHTIFTALFLFSLLSISFASSPHAAKMNIQKNTVTSSVQESASPSATRWLGGNWKNLVLGGVVGGVGMGYIGSVKGEVNPNEVIAGTVVAGLGYAIYRGRVTPPAVIETKTSVKGIRTPNSIKK